MYRPEDRDWIMGGDVREKRFPAGRFDGVIGGPPCQSFSALVHMVRQNGYEPQFGNLIPDFERVVAEVQPSWFLMENVPKAPRPKVDGYFNHEIILNNRQCFDESGEPATQNRVRAITFGYLGEQRHLLIDTVVFENKVFEYAACGGSSGSSLGAAGWDGGVDKKKTRKKFRDGKGGMPWNAKSGAAVKELCRKQGLPEDFADRLPFTVAAKCKAIGNGVPLPMGRAIARAVKEAVGLTPSSSVAD